MPDLAGPRPDRGGLQLAKPVPGPISELMRWLILLLPWIELYTLIQLGSRIGALSTLFYVFITLVLGLAILRLQGMEIIGRLRDAQQGGLVMGQFLADDLAVGFAGLLLLIPGLITDAMAALVLIGPLWRRLTGATPRAGDTAGGGEGPDPHYRAFRDAPGRHEPPGRSSGRGNAPIEGEYERLDDRDEPRS